VGFGNGRLLKNFFKSIKKIRYQKNYTSSQKEKASEHSPKISKT